MALEDPSVQAPASAGSSSRASRRRSFTNRVTWVLAAGLVLVGIVGIGAFIAINALVEHSRREAATHEAFNVLERTVVQFLATESLHRKFLITGARQDHEDYARARTEAAETLQRARALSDTLEQRRRFEALDRAIGQRLASMEQAIEARRTLGVEAAVAIVGSDRNQQLGREVGVLIAEFGNVDQRLLAISSAEAGRKAVVSQVAIGLGILLSISLLTWAIFVIARYQAQRERVEGRLRESDERSRGITERMADGVVTTEEDGTIVEANDAAKGIFGYPGEELIGVNVKSLVPERHRDAFEMILHQLRWHRGEIREPEREIRAVRKDGTTFHVKASFSDVRVGGKRVFTGLIRDITEGKRMARALEASATQLREVTDAVPALIAFIDPDRVVRFCNKAYEEYFGLDSSRILGCKLEDVVGAEIYRKLATHVEEALKGFPARYERSHTMPSGQQRYLEGHFFPRYGEGADEGKVIGFYSLVTDITELKRVDRMKSEFVSTVSHELRTPLTSIRGSLGLVAGGVAGVLPPAARNLIDIAKNNCERLIRLINDILDIERIESGKMQFQMKALALQPLLGQALAANEGFAAQHKVRLELASGADEAMVWADPDRLTQVVTNLLSNAVKFSPEGAAVEVTLSRTGDRLRVDVTDHGPGIPEEFRGRIFEKFSQADSSDSRAKGGSGLGLNISRSIVERFEGDIGFESEEGRGTTIFFELPEHIPALQRSAP